MGRHKKDLLKAVDALIKTNDAIGRSNPSGEPELPSLLMQCQETAIQIGTFLETLEGEYGTLVRRLEDYCELVYRMSRNISHEQSPVVREKEHRKQWKKVRGILAEVRNVIAYEMPEDRREVVFLPYKASMWDSLESVWEAAEADENTDAYVIPIPYYDKNPDESFREEHYEGDIFPDYVPITRYDEYDFQRRRPDAIFIHNPYDDCNIVTSVHPFFYSENLKEYTEKLVYIPYFVLDEVDPDNDKQVEGIKHLVIQPALFHSHKIVVQSEAMKKAYIRILLKQADQPSEEARKYWEEKILGLGSPKVDKLCRTEKTALTIPDEWERVIRKPDGGRKRIVFYNVGVGAVLQNGEKLLAKMEKVFKMFQERKDEIVLLWRPHPLMESTLSAMRPQLYEQYMEQRGRYLEEGWGIYDDSADMDRAVVVSDMYYGDKSSIVQLYHYIGKPVMIQSDFTGI